MPITANLYLTGFMASGKTSTGKLLAHELGAEFIDLDNYIEQKHGTTIPEIFAEQGELTFRVMELEALKEIHTHTNLVIALGGGAFCNEAAQELLKDAKVIFLDASAATLAHRLKHDSSERPLVAALGDDELEAYIQRTMLARRTWYERAAYRVVSEGETSAIVRTIIETLS